MYLANFLDVVDELYADVYEYDDSSSYLAETAAIYLVELIDRGFDVSDFLELIFTENGLYEYNKGVETVKEEIPF